MNKKNTKYLYDTYPEIFQDKDKSAQETCMCWGFECGDGWFQIIDTLCSAIQSHVDNPAWKPKDNIVTQQLKRLHNRFIWNKLIHPTLSWYYLRDVPRTYNDKDPNYATYESKWRAYNKRQDTLSLKIAYHKPPKDPDRQVIAAQVKEKYGGLCFYYSGGDDYIRGLVVMAQRMSYNTCELCGATHNVKQYSGGWIVTRCKSCKENADKKVAV